jgi:hypothetical protein
MQKKGLFWVGCGGFFEAKERIILGMIGHVVN